MSKNDAVTGLNRYAALTMAAGAALLLAPPALGKVASLMDPAAAETALKAAILGIGALIAAGAAKIALSAMKTSREKAIEAAVLMEREACASTIRGVMELRGRQECCGSGVYSAGGGPPECCSEPRLMIDGDDAIEAIRRRHKGAAA